MGARDSFVTNASFAEFQIEDQAPLAFFSILYLTVLHELRLVAESLSASETASTFPAVFSPSRVNWAPDDLRQYFRKKEPVSLKANAPAAQTALTELLNRASNAFIADLESFGIMFSELPLDSPLRYIQRVRDLTGQSNIRVSRSGNENFRRLDDSLFGEIVARDPKIAPENQVSSDETNPLSMKASKFRDHFVDEFSKFVSSAYKSINPSGDGYCLDLPGIPLSARALLLARYWGLRSLARAHPDRGLYYIIRQARGRRTSDELKVDIIVRDMLWLRQNKSDLNESGLRDLPIGDRKYGMRLGYYFSAIDRQVFEITNTAKRGDIVMIDAVAQLDHGKSKSLCLYFPSIMAPERFSLGSMVGSVEDHRTGAWTVVCMKADLPEADARSLELDLAIYSDSFREISTVSEYDSNTVLLNRWIEERKMIGVLYSRLWHDHALGKQKEILLGRREAFSSMFERWTGYGHDDDRLVEDLLTRITSDPVPDYVKLRDEIVGLLQHEERHALTPPVPAKRTQSGRNVELAALCDKSYVPSFSAYQKASEDGQLTSLTG